MMSSRTVAYSGAWRNPSAANYMARTTFLLYVLSCAALGLALDISGTIAWNDVCPNAKTLGQAKASIDNDVFRGGIMADGSFVIPGVPDGAHILSVISHDFFFDQLRIDVNNTNSAVEVRPYVPGTPMNPPSIVLLPYPIVITPKERFNYFVPPESFNIAGMFANPMMLLMVGGAAMMLAMPYIINNMDPEALEDFKAQQAKLGGIQSALQGGDIKSGFNAIMAAADESAQGSSSQVNKGAGTAKARVNKKAKR